MCIDHVVTKMEADSPDNNVIVLSSSDESRIDEADSGDSSTSAECNGDSFCLVLCRRCISSLCEYINYSILSDNR